MRTCFLSGFFSRRKRAEILIIGQNGDQTKRIIFLIGAIAELIKSPEFTEQEWMVLIASANGILPLYEKGLEAVLYSFATGIPYSDIYGSEFEQINKVELAQKYWLPKDSAIQCNKQWLIDQGAIIV